MLKFKNLTLNRNYLLRIFKYFPFKEEVIFFLNKINYYKLKRIKTPENLIFFVTNNCNAQCNHCFYWKSINNNKEEMSTENIEKFVSSLKNRIETLLITGGEPLMRPDIYKIIEIFYKINHTKKIHLASNGILSDKLFSLCRKILEEMNLELSVQISIDGDEEYHDKLRGVRGIYKKVIKSLKLLKILEAKYPNFILTTSTVLTKSNINQLENISKEMKKLNVKWGFQLLRGSTFGILGIDKSFIIDYDPKDKFLNLPSKKEIKDIIKKYSQKKEDLREILQNKLLEISLLIINNKKPFLKCRAGVVDGVVYPNGDVALCEMTRPFSNLKDFNFNLYKLWKSEKSEIARKKIENCSCIHPCHIINSIKYDYRVFL